MDLIKHIFEVITRGKLEYRVAILFFLGLIITTGSENIVAILKKFNENEIFGFLFIQQLWAVYSVFLIGVAAHFVDQFKPHLKFVGDLLKMTELNNDVEPDQLTLVHDVIGDTLNALIALFLSFLFALSILLVDFGLKIESSTHIFVVFLILKSVISGSINVSRKRKIRKVKR